MHVGPHSVRIFGGFHCTTNKYMVVEVAMIEYGYHNRSLTIALEG